MLRLVLVPVPLLSYYPPTYPTPTSQVGNKDNFRKMPNASEIQSMLSKLVQETLDAYGNVGIYDPEMLAEIDFLNQTELLVDLVPVDAAAHDVDLAVGAATAVHHLNLVCGARRGHEFAGCVHLERRRAGRKHPPQVGAEVAR